MAMQRMDDTVTVEELTRRLGIPRRAVYRLAERGRIPYEDATMPWHDTKRYRFDVAKVAAALGMPVPDDADRSHD